MMSNMPENTAVVMEENRRVRMFRFLTDLTEQRLYIEPITIHEALGLVSGLGYLAERFFPGRKGVFDLVIRPRLERVIRERFGPDSFRRIPENG